MRVHVRRGHPEDMVQVKDIYSRVHPHPVPRTDAEWARFLIIVAPGPDELRGYNLASFAYPGYLVGWETMVRPVYQNQGVGRALMTARMALLGTRVYLGGVEDGNARMIHLLESFGLVPIQRVPYPTGKEGTVYASLG